MGIGNMKQFKIPKNTLFSLKHPITHYQLPITHYQTPKLNP
ncbi:alpha/beta hydrolase [Tolypothrix sp. PCC 7712]|nr:alpha/beta hydrolase [Tolypothrix sp. PCC 7712]